MKETKKERKKKGMLDKKKGKILSLKNIYLMMKESLKHLTVPISLHHQHRVSEREE